MDIFKPGDVVIHANQRYIFEEYNLFSDLVCVISNELVLSVVYTKDIMHLIDYRLLNIQNILDDAI